jgi:vancomycin resistance protein YoaR
LNGLLVNNGETFSTIGALDPITEAHGYVAGLVILGNETIPEDGGGLCQVSTTLFRAVLNAGLPVVERVNHSYEVSYYQRGIGPGLDATIYDPSPDFKWKNDTGNPIYIEASISGTNLTFNLYGTSDGRTASIDGPKTLKTYPVTGSPIHTKTNTLPAGKVELIDPPVEGALTTATYTVMRGGKVINKQVFNSYYQPMPAQYLDGTG